MTDQDDSLTPKRATQDGGDRIGRLVRLAGAREAMPVDRMDRLRAATRAEWRRHTRARARRRMTGWSLAACAAAALLALGVRQAMRSDAGDAAVTVAVVREPATVEAVRGAVRRIAPPSGGVTAELALVEAGQRLRDGDGVDTTGGGQAALRLVGGISVRVDRDTRVRVLTSATIALDAGALYVDSGGSGGSVEIRTPVGIVRDIGTRFEARLTADALRVRVRDGLVRLSQSRASHDARAGEQLTLAGSGAVARLAVPTHGQDWAWTTSIAPPFAIEGRMLREFLEWVVLEQGWQLRYADAAAERTARTTALHGSVDGLTPEQAVAAVLPPSGVEPRLDSGVLLIRQSGGGPKD